MGCANNWLIPPAILYNHPGITRDEFVELLDETRTGDGKLEFHDFGHWENAPWNFVGVEDGDYHKGLHGLAEILGLKSLEIKWKERDRNGFPLLSPRLGVEPVFYNGKWDQKYTVDVHTGNERSEQKEAEWLEFKIIKEGDVFHDEFDNGYLVDKVVERKSLPDDEKDFWKEQAGITPRGLVKILGRPIIQEWEEHDFFSLSLLVQQYHFFDPDFMYDFSQREGVFSAPSTLVIHNALGGLRWRQENGRYYLNIENLPSLFQHISPISAQSGYTDLVVSAEALKLKAWKMFAFHAYERERTELFLQTFPEAGREHARAVWAGYTSEYAKMNEMTINNFLRFRLLHSVKR